MKEEDLLNGSFPFLTLEAERGWPSPRKQRLFAVACCRRVIHLLSEDSPLRSCIEVAERYAEKEIKLAELKAVNLSLRAAQRKLGSRKRSYQDTLEELIRRAVIWASEPTRRKYAGQVPSSAASAAAYTVVPVKERYVPPASSKYYQEWLKAEKVERAAQVTLLRDVCGDPFHPITPRIGRVSPDFSPTFS